MTRSGYNRCFLGRTISYIRPRQMPVQCSVAHGRGASSDPEGGEEETLADENSKEALVPIHGVFMGRGRAILAFVRSPMEEPLMAAPVDPLLRSKHDYPIPRAGNCSSEMKACCDENP